MMHKGPSNQRLQRPEPVLPLSVQSTIVLAGRAAAAG